MKAWPNDGDTQCDHCQRFIDEPNMRSRPDYCHLPHYGECAFHIKVKQSLAESVVKDFLQSNKDLHHSLLVLLDREPTTEEVLSSIIGMTYGIEEQSKELDKLVRN